MQLTLPPGAQRLSLRSTRKISSSKASDAVRAKRAFNSVYYDNGNNAIIFICIYYICSSIPIYSIHIYIYYNTFVAHIYIHIYIYIMYSCIHTALVKDMAGCEG